MPDPDWTGQRLYAAVPRPATEREAMPTTVLTDDPIKQQAKIEHLREAVAAASSSMIDWVGGGPS